MGQAAYYWSSSINPDDEQGYVYSSYLRNEAGIHWDSPLNKFSVRLVKD
ncbi:MAG: hypothetical protein IPH45_05315 [Bacteroidales bacterium]|nr:hypothetical protein [Bacteroidales bacterium]